ncbi:MAG TPA: EamA family transporter [Ilumatobacteraceae bacterium]|nr:EamA family transporter [Ilumatobacteraceae bacterium]
MNTAQPEALFVLSAVAQYLGAVIAVGLFDEVEPQTVAWFRVIGAAVAVVVASRAWRERWTRSELLAAALFGVVTALMNTFFYLGIARVDLGIAVTIEFIGPITVAAVATRNRRNALALLFAIAGVLVLGGTEIDGNAIGLLFIFLASVMWAGYIVIGSRVARLDRGLSGLGVGLAIGALAITPIGAPGSLDVWSSPRLLALCLLVGVFSNAIGYGIDQFTMRRIPVRRFSLLLALLPVTAVLIGWLVLDQQPSGIEFVGIALVVVGVIVQEREELAPIEAEILTEPS